MEGGPATPTPLPSSAGVPGPLPCTEKAPHPREQAYRPRATPAAFRISAAQSLECLWTYIWNCCWKQFWPHITPICLGGFESQKMRWFCRTGVGSTKTQGWGRGSGSAGPHPARELSPPPALTFAAGAAPVMLDGIKPAFLPDPST